MNITTLPTGARGIDTVTPLTDAHCVWLKAHGYDFAVRYATSLSTDERDRILSAGLALSLVTYAHSYDPKDELAAIARLGIPQGAHLFLDVEDDKLDHVSLAQRINAWSMAIKPTGIVPAIYVGSGNPLTSTELYALPVYSYWHSCSRVVDRDGRDAAPSCGWSMIQLVPGNIKLDNGLVVDVNVVQADYRARGVRMVTR